MNISAARIFIIQDKSEELQKEPSTGLSGVQHVSTPAGTTRKYTSELSSVSPEHVQSFPKA